MNKSKKNNIIIITLILLICFISIGYSFLETDLNFGGVAKVTGVPRLTVPDLVAKANPENKDYNTSTEVEKGEMYTFSHPETEQTSALTDYRYIGSKPNNYIEFNNETWRIIGVFDGRIKIIREDPIGGFSWDNKDTTTGAETDNGKNDWTDARLMKLLNPGYENETNGGSLYYSRKNGNCYFGFNNKVVTCSFSNIGLTNLAKTQIDKATYYLGGRAYDDITHYGTGSDMYIWERGSTTWKGRNTKWEGMVGLMYPSDYVYTYANGVSNECFNHSMDCLSSLRISWLNNHAYHWTISPISNLSTHALILDDGGGIRTNGNGVIDTYPVYPVVYLKSNIILVGNGSKYEMYKIV